MDSIRPKTKELMTYYCGCHGNLVTIAIRFVANVYCPIQNMDSIQLKPNELLTYYCGCHGNLVTIAARYVADAYCPKEPL